MIFKRFFEAINTFFLKSPESRAIFLVILYKKETSEMTYFALFFQDVIQVFLHFLLHIFIVKKRFNG